MKIDNWSIGVVEDVNDPTGAGRARVRVMGYHSPDRNELPTSSLSWSSMIMPVTSPSIVEIGQSSTGLLPGSWVFGFFRDGSECQDYVILGSVSGAAGYTPGFDSVANYGFGDEHGAFSNLTSPDIPNMLGRLNAPVSGFSPGPNTSYSSSFEDPPTPLNLVGGAGDKFISVAQSQRGVKETSKNQGPGIEKYWSATSYGVAGYHERLPWCAAFVSWVVKSAGVLSQDKLPNTAGAFEFQSWAKSNGIPITMSPRSVSRGDIVVFSFSHIGIATSDSSGNSFTTIEGNTDSSGSREGGGVWEKTRSLSSLSSAIHL